MCSSDLDPDRTKEDEADFWTLWDYKTSMWYRKTTRRRAHVIVEDAGEGMVRVGVAVITQINDNMDNQHSIEDARWVKTEPDTEWAMRIEQQIGRRYLDAEPSEAWKEKNREEKRKGLRPDLADRYRDVDLGEAQVVMDLQAVVQPTIDRARRDIIFAASGVLFVGLLIAFALSGRIRG